MNVLVTVLTIGYECTVGIVNIYDRSVPTVDADLYVKVHCRCLLDSIMVKLLTCNFYCIHLFPWATRIPSAPHAFIINRVIRIMHAQ